MVALAVFVLMSINALAQSCLRASFQGTIKAADSFATPLGNGLVFHLNPLRDKWGWTVVVSPQNRATDDWAYPVNPPLRFGNSQYMGTGYGESVKQQLSYSHEISFLLSSADYERMSKLAEDALWPYKSSQPENATTKYLAALKDIARGTLAITPVDYESAGSPETVEWMKFRAVVIVPREFSGSNDLRWSSGSCKP